MLTASKWKYSDSGWYTTVYRVMTLKSNRPRSPQILRSTPPPTSTIWSRTTSTGAAAAGAAARNRPAASMMLTSTATGRTGLSDTAPPFIKLSGDLPAPAGLASAVSLAAASGHRDHGCQSAWLSLEPLVLVRLAPSTL